MFLWVQSPVNILLFWPQQCIGCLILLERVFTISDCIWKIRFSILFWTKQRRYFYVVDKCVLMQNNWLNCVPKHFKRQIGVIRKKKTRGFVGIIWQHIQWISFTYDYLSSSPTNRGPRYRCLQDPRRCSHIIQVPVPSWEDFWWNDTPVVNRRSRA